MDKDLTEYSFCLNDVTTVNLRQKKTERVKVTAVIVLPSYQYRK